MKKSFIVSCASCALAAALLAPAAAYAVDGQILINQARALAGGVTPGDTPGFPVTISEPGSYRLSSNLIVPNANTVAIVIAASHVTLDLNGFAILGPTDCSGGLDPCAGAGSANGIETTSDQPQFNITIRNGTIQGVGHRAVLLFGDSHLVEYLHVRSNGNGGITIRPSADFGSSIVQYTTAQRNDGVGIRVDKGLVRHSVADVNGTGIEVGTGSASHNVVTRNVIGINLNPQAGFFGNVANDNLANTNGGVNLGHNLCTGTGGGC